MDVGVQLNTIYREGCLETMSRIKSDSVDLVITSPPYNKAGYEGFIRKPHKSDTWNNGKNIAYGGDANNDFVPEAEYQEQQIAVLNEIHRILKPRGSLFYNHKVRIAQHRASHPIEWLLKSNLIFRQQIVWDRKSSPALAPNRYLPTTELIFWMTKTACQPNFHRSKNVLFATEVWTFPPQPNPKHPAPFPPELPRNILTCLENREDVVVYDPYSGIGTTLIAAYNMGINYIGSEIQAEYAEWAEKELQALKNQMKLF